MTHGYEQSTSVKAATQEHAPLVQPVWRDNIQLEHVLKGKVYLSKQNSATSLQTWYC